MSNLPHLVLHSEAARLASDRDLRRAFANGRFHRVASGVYVDGELWATLGSDDRYRLRVRAAALRSPAEAQFSHDSAAALWRLPSIGPWPSGSHELTAKRSGGSSRVDIRRHGLGIDPHPDMIDGVTVTSLARTLVDVSCSSSFIRSVAMLDCAQRTPRRGEPRWGLPTAAVTQTQLLQTLDDLRPYKGSARAERAIRFSTGQSGSAGESVGRVNFHALGYPEPELQVEFFDEHGSIGFADYYWPELDLIGEFDGLSKYGSGRYFQADLSLDQILMREKAREDRMRRVVRSFARLTWALVNDRRALEQHLRPHGLRPGRARAV